MSLRAQLVSGLRDHAAAWSVAGCIYDGPAGFVLEHGETRELLARNLLPDDVPAMPPRYCYSNAIVLAVQRGFSYVEGYAVSTIVPWPVAHAWNVTPDGRLLDATWGGVLTAPRTRRPTRAAYRGVVFSVQRADDCSWHGDASVLDDWQRGWPLLQQPWEGEDFSIVWPPSPRLDMLRDGDSASWQDLGPAMDAEAADALSSRIRRGEPDAIARFQRRFDQTQRGRTP